MKSPDQIAREFIWNLVTVDCPQSNQEWNVMIGGKMLPQYQITEEIAEIHAGEVRRIIEDTIRAAVEEALYQSALPNGMTASRLVEIEGIITALGDVVIGDRPLLEFQQVAAVYEALEDLRAELLLMRRVMDGPEAAAYAAGYDEGLRKGFATGALAQRDASADEVLDAYVEGDGWNSELCRRVARIVRNAPLATPGEEES